MSGACVPIGNGGWVCYETCWACKFQDHFNPPRWHTWADPEDVHYALAAGHSDPSDQRCGCKCASAEREVIA